MLGYVYIISAPSSMKIYVGSAIDPKRRWEEHKWNAEHGVKLPIYDFLRKHKDDAQFDVLYSTETIEEARGLEKKFYHIILEEQRLNVIEPDSCPMDDPAVRDKHREKMRSPEIKEKMLKGIRSPENRERIKEQIES